jgi:hypothetical protein
MENKKNKVEVVSASGPVWIIGWLFTIGFLKLSFWQSVLALIIWAYYLGDFLSRLAS